MRVIASLYRSMDPKYAKLSKFSFLRLIWLNFYTDNDHILRANDFEN